MHSHSHRLFGAWKPLALAGLLLAGASTALAQQPPAAEKIADAKPGEVRLLISNGLRAPFEAVRAQAQQAVGHPLVVEYGASRRLQSEIEAGQPFEAAILTGEVVDEMIARHKVVAGSRADLAHVPVAAAERGDAPRPDISTPAALKAALLGAATVRFADIGASRPTVDNTFAKLGITDALQDRTGPLPGPSTPQPTLAAGQYELILNLASEFHPVAGQTYLGPLPEQFQVPVVMAAGVGASGDAAAARTLIAFLQGPAIEPALTASRMTR